MQISSQRIQSAALPPASAPARPAAPSQAASANSRGVSATDASPSQAAAAPQGDHQAGNLARIDSFTEALMGRLEMAAKDAPRGEADSFAKAAESLQSGLSRLRAGLENGTLQPDDIQRGVGNAFQGARDILEAARQPADDPVTAKAEGDDGTPTATDVGATVRGRFAGFAESVMARVQGLDVTDRGTGAAVEEAAAAFESATSRLDAALFNPESGDPIDRGTFKTLFAEALSTLQSQLTDLLGGSGGQNGVIYNAQSTAQGLMSPIQSIDVAG